MNGGVETCSPSLSRCFTDGVLDSFDQAMVSSHHTKVRDSTQHESLHLCLKKKCTEEASRTVCHVISALNGNRLGLNCVHMTIFNYALYM